MQKLLLTFATLSLLGGCSSEGESDQPITGADAPTLEFSLSEITMSESAESFMTFTTSNAGSNAVVKPISNELVNAEVDGSTLIIRAPAVDFSTNQTTLSVEISYGGQSTTTTIPITVTNSSGLEYVAQANALFSGISTIGDEDVSLAASVTDIAPVNNIVLDDELASLADFVSTLQTSSETTQFTSSISSSLLAYSNDEIDENALYEAIIDAELYFSSAPVEELNSLMVPFANFLGDFTMSEVSEFTYSQEIGRAHV